LHGDDAEIFFPATVLKLEVGIRGWWRAVKVMGLQFAGHARFMPGGMT